MLELLKRIIRLAVPHVLVQSVSCVPSFLPYDAFISYSHAADGQLAPRLQTALERYAVPWYRRPILRIFRDETNLSATPHAWPTIEMNLDRARFLILMASPNAANSKWVHREVEHWLATKSAETLLIVLTAGDISWDDARGDFDWTKTTALPDVLKDRFVHEPLYVDLRNWGKAPNELSLLNDHFADKVLRLAAPLRGKPMDELSVQAVREVNRRIRHARIAMAVIAVLAVAAGTAAVGFWTQRDQALTALAQSNSHELAARARVTSLDRFDLAIVLAMRSIDLARASGVSWTEGASALRDIMAQTHGSRAYCLQGSQSEGRAIGFSESRRLVAVGTQAGVVCIFRRGDDNSLRLLDTLQSFHEVPLDDIQFSADGEWLVTHLRGGALRALHVGELYGNANAVQQGRANYEFHTFGDTDTAKALSFDAQRSRIGFFSSASQKIEIWPLLNLDPDHGPAVTLDPGGHALATAFDPTGMYFASLVLDRGQGPQNESTWQFWEPETRNAGKNLKFHVKVWLLATQFEVANFEVIAEQQDIYFGDGISMGSLHGLLRLGPEARWVAPAMFLSDQHSLERRLVAQVIRVAGAKVLANFMEGAGDRSFDDWRRVTDIGFTSDGGAFFALNDSVVRFWSLADPAEKGEKPRRLMEYIAPSASAGASKAQGVVSALTLSADGRFLAALDSADSLTVWDVKAGLAGKSSAPLAFVEGIGKASRGSPTALRFDADAETIVFAAGSGEVRLCDVKNRCGSATPRQAAAPEPGGGQWKDFTAPEHGQWIAAVAESQVVSFFRPNDLGRPFFKAAASDTPAPVVSRGYAVLSGTPGRPVAVISSAEGAWAAIFERQQYGFNEKLRLVWLKDRPQVFDVELVSKGCADRFSTVAFDLFAHSLAIFAPNSCVAFVKLPEGNEITTSQIKPLIAAQTEFEVESLSFSKNYIVASASGKAQLWERDRQTGLPSHSLFAQDSGVLLLPPDEKSIIAVTLKGKDAKQAVSAAQFAGFTSPIKFTPVGGYTFVSAVAMSPDGALLVIVGKRNDRPQETVAVWNVGMLDRPLVEHASQVAMRNPAIIFNSSSHRVFIGPTEYAVSDQRPYPANADGVLFDFSGPRASARTIQVNFGVAKEGCFSSDGISCYHVRYSFSPDGAWLGIERPQPFGDPGFATIVALKEGSLSKVDFSETEELGFSLRSQWLVTANADEVRLWQLDSASAKIRDRGRLSGAGLFSVLADGRSLLMLVSGQLSVNPLEIDDLLSQVGNVVGRNLSPGEWRTLFPTIGYGKVVQSLPLPPEAVYEVVDHAELLAAEGDRVGASEAFVTAARFAVETGSVRVNNDVVKAALKLNLCASARGAAEYAAKILAKDSEIQKRLECVGDAPGARP